MTLVPTLAAATDLALYVGYVLFAGALAFWALAWAQGWRDRRQVLVAQAGMAVVVLATALTPIVVASDVTTRGDSVDREWVVASLVRLAVVAAAAGFFTDLVSAPVQGGRRWAAGLAVLVLAATLPVDPASGWPALSPFLVTVHVAHLVSLAAVLGCTIGALMAVAQGLHVEQRDIGSRVTRVTAVGCGVLLAAAALLVVLDAQGAASTLGSSTTFARHAVAVGAVLVVARLMARGLERRAAGLAPRTSTGVWSRLVRSRWVAVLVGAASVGSLVVTTLQLP